MPYLREIMDAVSDPMVERIVMKTSSQVGKALAIDTPIIAPTGWPRIGDLRVGDVIHGSDAEPCSVVAVTDVMVGRPCYSVRFDDGAKIVADAQHSWRLSDDSLVTTLDLARMPPARRIGHRRLVSVTPVESVPVRCIQVDSPDGMFLAGRECIPTHNSELICNVLGYFIHQDPSPILMVQPREFDARKFSKSRIAPMIRETPVLRERVAEAKTRDSDNTILEKLFPGGRMVIVGANSPAGLAGDPIRVLLLDEVDRFPASAGAEGDPVDLAEARTYTFANRVIIMTSSPTDEGTSRIDAAYQQSTREHLEVPCPHCGDYQALVWDQVKWKKKPDTGYHQPETAVYECIECDEPWTEAQRHRAVRSGKWIAEGTFRGTRGFHLNALYAPWANLSLPALAKKWLSTTGRPLQQKAFKNTVLGEVWKAKYKAAPGDLETRLEDYPERAGRVVVPSGVLVITAGADVQDDRIEIQITGFGVDNERWRLQYHILEGHPGNNEVWELLWDVMLTPLELESGGYDFIRATCLDTGGHHTQRAYDFARPRWKYQTPDNRRGYLFAIKGKGGVTGNVWPTAPTRTNIGKVPLYNLYVDPAKDELYASLSRIVEPGPGYIHFPRKVEAGIAFDRRYFEQLNAERCVIDTDSRGFEKRVWEKKSPDLRNEGLDTSLYSDAAIHGLIQMGFDWDRARAQRSTWRPAGEVPKAPASAKVREKREQSGAGSMGRRPTGRRRRTASKYLGER